MAEPGCSAYLSASTCTAASAACAFNPQVGFCYNTSLPCAPRIPRRFRVMLLRSVLRPSVGAGVRHAGDVPVVAAAERHGHQQLTVHPAGRRAKLHTHQRCWAVRSDGRLRLAQRRVLRLHWHDRLPDLNHIHNNHHQCAALSCDTSHSTLIVATPPVCSTFSSSGTCNAHQPTCLWVTSASQCYDCTKQNCVWPSYALSPPMRCRCRRHDDGGVRLCGRAGPSHLRNQLCMGQRHIHVPQPRLLGAHHSLRLCAECVLQRCRRRR